MPDLGDLGDIADDLRTKLESVIGKTPSPSGSGGRSGYGPVRRIDPGDLDRRLRDREQRRRARRARS
jgi:hypothetical protein